MIKHIVMWKVKSENNENKNEVISNIKEKLEALPLKIDEIQVFEVGINHLDSSAAYDICLYSEFKNQNDLNIYQNHPEHLKVKDYIVSVVSDRAVIDYNI